MKLPEYRQEGCIWLSKEDGWGLRESIKPFDSPPAIAEGLCAKVYEALLRLELNGGEGVNVQISTAEALLINQYLKSGMWKGVDELLCQTWMVLHEVHYAPFAILKPGAAFVLYMEEEHAVHQPEDEVAAGGLSDARKPRRTKLPPDPAGTGLSEDQGGELSNVL